MVKFISASASLLVASGLLHLAQVQGHGFLKTPRSRNFVAQEDGTWAGGAGSQGVPQKETCHHCLNRKEPQNLCSKGNAATLYDHWKDVNGVPMQWNSQAVYEEGQEFTVESVLTTNHAGHMEIWLCVLGDDSTQECLHQNPATMVRDEMHGGPADPRYPERGYFASGASEFRFTYRLPENFYGEKILMQWHYVTANSCIPPGYRDGEAGARLAELGWLRSMGMSDCPIPLDPTGAGVPEQFWNCAEITITPKTPSPPTTSPPVAAPVAPPVAPPVAQPTPPTGNMKATTTRYWDCSGGACGCAYLPFEGDTNNPSHCYSNAMFDAPANNPYGAKFYGSAAVSAALFADNDGDGWLGEGCDKCWKVTGTSNTPGNEGMRTTTMVLKGSNYCPPENPACSGGKVHFDIAAPGFDVTAFSFAHVCPQLEEEEKEGFAACGSWMIDVQDPSQNCDCSKFKNPILRAGCENFFYLQWDNAQVDYEEVPCPYELDRLNCWRENNDGYPFDIPKFCASNLDGPSPTPSPTPSQNTPSPTPSPTPPPTPPPVSNCGSNTSACCTQNMKDCISWCGSTKSSCLNCGQDVFWTECPNQNCKPRWADCTRDVDGCCDGLECVGNQWYRQCKVAANPVTPSPTKSPATPAPTDTPQTSSPTASNGCYSNNYKDCIHPEYSTGGSSCTKVWLPDGAQSNCIALWGDCTGQTNSCCGDAVCFTGTSDSYATCVPPS